MGCLYIQLMSVKTEIKGLEYRIGVVPKGRAGGQAERSLVDANPVSPMNPCIEDRTSPPAKLSVLAEGPGYKRW